MELIKYSYLNIITFFNILLHNKIDKLKIDMKRNKYTKTSLTYKAITKEEQIVQVLTKSMSYLKEELNKLIYIQK